MQESSPRAPSSALAEAEMKVTVTTPTGNIGSKLADLLLNSPDVQLTVLARKPQKVQHLAGRGTRVVAGDQLDPATVDQALEGAEVLFWLTGVDYTATDILARYKRFGDAAADALRRHPGLRVVHLSSVGAEHSENTGPIRGLHYAEQKLNAAGSDVTHLRANYFMENVRASLPTIAAEGAIYSSTPGSISVEQVATADIAAAAAHYLLKGSRGHHVVDVFGPERITFDEVARQVGTAIGKPVKHVQIPADALKAALLAQGLTADLAAQLVELEDAIAKGIVAARLGDAQWQGTTRFAQFAREVVKPAHGRLTAAA
jgi:uncharacterized protein YbjT (DUF2867 family)